MLFVQRDVSGSCGGMGLLDCNGIGSHNENFKQSITGVWNVMSLEAYNIECGEACCSYGFLCCVHVRMFGGWCACGGEGVVTWIFLKVHNDCTCVVSVWGICNVCKKKTHAKCMWICVSACVCMFVIVRVYVCVLCYRGSTNFYNSHKDWLILLVISFLRLFIVEVSNWMDATICSNKDLITCIMILKIDRLALII